MQGNRVEISGHLATRPETRYLASGTKVANARLGETYRTPGKDGATQTSTNWHRLVFYNEIADVAATYEQGENIHVVGTIQQRTFTPADGSRRTVHEIHVWSCHLIAPPRAKSGMDTRELKVSSEYTLEGIDDDDGWPVSRG